MTEKRIIRALLTTMGAAVLSVAGFYFGIAGQKKRLLMTCMFLGVFVFAIVISWYKEKRDRVAPTSRQHLLRGLLFGLLAIAYLAQAVVSPFNGSETTRMWLFGTSWLLLAICELSFYRKTDIRESR